MNPERFADSLVILEALAGEIVSRMELQDSFQRETCVQVVRHLFIATAHIECLMQREGESGNQSTTGKIAEHLRHVLDVKN